MPKLNVTRFQIEGPALVEPPVHGDERGWFCETWNRADWLDAGLPDVDWVQDNQAFSAAPATTRGLHFQAPPHAQAKLIRVLRGRIFDAIVDLRVGSPTYGKAMHVELSGKSPSAVFAPVGFAHGYQTLATDTMVTYKVSAHYAPASEGGLLWSGIGPNIPWPMPEGVVMSGRDFTWPTLGDLQSPFRYGDT